MKPRDHIPRVGRPLAALLAMALLACSGCAGMVRMDYGHFTTRYIESLNNIGASRRNWESEFQKWADEFEHTINLATIRNKDELREFFEGWAELFSTWEHVETRRLVHDNLVAWEGIARGIHRSTGRPLSVPMAMIIEFDEEGRASMVHVYFDTGVLQEQLLDTS